MGKVSTMMNRGDDLFADPVPHPTPESPPATPSPPSGRRTTYPSTKEHPGGVSGANPLSLKQLGDEVRVKYQNFMNRYCGGVGVFIHGSPFPPLSEYVVLIPASLFQPVFLSTYNEAKVFACCEIPDGVFLAVGPGVVHATRSLAAANDTECFVRDKPI